MTNGSLLIALAIMLVAAGCRTEGDEPPAAPTLWVLCIDVSASPQAQDRERWAKACTCRLDELKQGDGVLIFGLHENTATAAPLFEGYSPVIRPGATASEVLRAREEHRRMIEGSKAAVKQWLWVPTAQRTHILDVLGRIRPDPSRPQTRIVFYSDMIESSPLIDLAHFNLSGREVATARAVVERVGLTGLGLEARVECFLDDVGRGQAPRTVNSRRALEAFWREVFAQVGAELVWFESRVPPCQSGGRR